jgi:hypothetical protein
MFAALLARFGLSGIATHIALGLFIAAMAGSALLGWGVRDAFCDAAEAKAELKLAQAEVDKLGRELSGYKAGSDNAAMAVATLTDLKDKQDAKLKQIAAELEKSKAPACRPTADSIRRLLSIP